MVTISKHIDIVSCCPCTTVYMCQGVTGDMSNKGAGQSRTEAEIDKGKTRQRRVQPCVLSSGASRNAGKSIVARMQS